MQEITEEKARQVLLFLNGGEDFEFEHFSECNVFLRSKSGLSWYICDTLSLPIKPVMSSDVLEDQRCKRYLDKCFEHVKSYDIVKGFLWKESVMKQGTTLEQVLIDMDLKV